MVIACYSTGKSKAVHNYRSYKGKPERRNPNPAFRVGKQLNGLPDNEFIRHSTL